MYATRLNPPQHSRRRRSIAAAAVRSSRQGFASGLVLLMLVFLAGFIALGLNVSRLSQVQTQLRTVCQASALSAAAELLDEDFLAGEDDQRDDIAAARETARKAALANFVDGRPVDLNLNPDNTPLGDIVVGSIDPLMPVGRPIALPLDVHQAQGLNTVRVTARMKLNTYNKVTLFCGALLGVLSTDAASNAQATLDRRIAGFRPESGVRVPVVPVCVEYESWMKQATARCRTGINDNYTIDYATGEVTPGPDGIPEIIVSTLPPQAATAADVEAIDADADTAAESEQSAENPPPAWCRTLVLDGDAAADPWSTRCSAGLSQRDLETLGGQLIVLPQGATPVATLPNMPSELPGALMSIVGGSRAWALAEAGADESTCEIVGFGAGRIVAVRAATEDNDSAAGNWEIVVQPTTLVSSQAVTTPNMNPNPWIGKLELTQ